MKFIPLAPAFLLALFACTSTTHKKSLKAPPLADQLKLPTDSGILGQPILNFTLQTEDDLAERWLSTPMPVNFSDADLRVAQDLKLRISEAAVSNRDGQAFPRFQYLNQFHENLALYLGDEAKARKIASEFEVMLNRLNTTKSIKNFLIRFTMNRALMLGSQSAFLLSELEKDLLFAGFDLGQTATHWPQVRQNYQDFMQAISEQEKEGYTRQPNSKTVMILTTKSGGGHFSVAEAIYSYIKRHTPYNPQLVIIDDYPDHLKKVSLDLSNGDIYNLIHQKEGNESKAHDYWNFATKLTKFVPDDAAKAIKTLAKELHPGFIINTCVFTSKYDSVAYSLDTPILNVATDYDIWVPLDHVILLGDPQISQVSLTETKATVLAGFIHRARLLELSHAIRIRPEIQTLVNSYERITDLQQTYNDENTHYLSLDPSRVFGLPDKLSAFVTLNRNHLFDFRQYIKNIPSLHSLGYPIREEIRWQLPFAIADKLAAFNIKDGEKSLLIAMGSQVKPSLVEVVAELAKGHEALEKVDHIFLLAGQENTERYRLFTEKINEAIQTAPEGLQKKFRILGYQSAEAMNQLYNMTVAQITKPGGATTAEVLETNGFMIMYDLNPGETLNALLGEYSGQAYLIPPQRTDLILDGLEYLLNRKTQRPYRPLNWQMRLSHYLDTTLSGPNRKLVSTASPLPKTIWTFWDSGKEAMPAFHKFNIGQWQRLLGAAWTIKVLNLVPDDPDYIFNYIDHKDLPSNFDTLERVISPRDNTKKAVVQSDHVRLAILRKLGGVWLDASIVLLKHLEKSFWFPALNDGDQDVAGYLNYSQASENFDYLDGFENWFIAARPGSPLIAKWQQAFIRYWETKNPDQDITLHPMYQGLSLGYIHHGFRNYLNQHTAFKYTLYQNEGLHRSMITGDASVAYSYIDITTWDPDRILDMFVNESRFPEFKNHIMDEVKADLIKFPSANLTRVHAELNELSDFEERPNLIKTFYQEAMESERP